MLKLGNLLDNCLMQSQLKAITHIRQEYNILAIMATDQIKSIGYKSSSNLSMIIYIF